MAVFTPAPSEPKNRRMRKKGRGPSLNFGLDLPARDGSFRRVMPFRRSWLAILVLAAIDCAFIYPAVFTFTGAIAEWRSYDSLFDLVAALFLSAWLLGWMIAPVILSLILVLMLFGREVLKASPATVEIFLGIPYLGVTARYDVVKMRNLRFEQPPKKSGKSWRGPHLVFDYGPRSVAFGSDIEPGEVPELRDRLQSATGAKIRHGRALPEEIGSKIETAIPLQAKAASEVISKPLTLKSPTTLVLIAANLVPVFGSAFMGWNLADVMVLYWAESAVIGFFNICKIIVVGRWAALLTAPFFAGHFGAFMAVHFLFIYTLFIKGFEEGGETVGELAEVASLFTRLWPALLALFISHGFSFFSNFLGRREYLGRTVNNQMSEPYGRIIFMQLVLIFGGGVTLVLGTPVPVLIIMIALKIIFDVKAHLKQHAGARQST